METQPTTTEPNTENIVYVYLPFKKKTRCEISKKYYDKKGATYYAKMRRAKKFGFTMEEMSHITTIEELNDFCYNHFKGQNKTDEEINKIFRKRKTKQSEQ
tara:strand:- start:1549 stop:1851 length:303 start_codon:yes stop_codon:yes gene_type:complete